MFIGHLGAGLALKRVAPNWNLCWLVLSSFLLDILLWCFVLLGIEKVIVPPNYQELRYMNFVFPYSHGMAAAVAWSLLAYFVVRMGTGTKRFALAIGLGVFIHFLLDVLTHPPQIPLFAEGSVMLGLSLWDHLYMELSIEVLILAAGLFVYQATTAATTFTGRFGLSIFLAFITFAAIGGQLFGPPPATGQQAAVSSLGTIVLLLVVVFLLDRKRIIKLP